MSNIKENEERDKGEAVLPSRPLNCSMARYHYDENVEYMYECQHCADIYMDKSEQKGIHLCYACLADFYTT